MTISYNWLCEYVPVKLEPEKFSKILTSIGLEVDNLERYQEVKGALNGLIFGEVLETLPHPNADKLTITKVNIGNGKPLQIVCGAPNVAPGQKVIVATIGTTIYPITSGPVMMKMATIRGIESYGMICAEDEIGLGTSHAGILILPDDVKVGTLASEYFKPYEDWIFEIGLTPNRMDAMSHLGVARDICAYLSYHDKKEHKVKWPHANGFAIDNHNLPIAVTIEKTNACERYSGISITNVTVKKSPQWLQQKLKAIGLRPINNIVDITNFVQYETGQPIHAYNADAIKGKKIIVKNSAGGSKFTTLDEKERILNVEDLMICDAAGDGLCIAGVFGGLHSGVTEQSRNIFLESAWFNPQSIRKTSFRHGLRTDAASRFEKGTDISNTITALKRGALMIKEIAGGEIASDIVDVYPEQKEKTEIAVKYHYLKKLSGKNYHPDAIKNILHGLGFGIIKEGIDELWISVPYHKPDVSLPADIAEEIIRIDGFDNINITGHITFNPSAEENYNSETYRHKISDYLAGLGFNEIMTNSITNSAFYNEEELQQAVKMLNNLSAELNMMRLSMMETGLESIAYNLNRKNNDLKLFEFGKTYRKISTDKYDEEEHLCLYVTGSTNAEGWKNKSVKADFFYLKGIAMRIVESLGLQLERFDSFENVKIKPGLQGIINAKPVFELGMADNKSLATFDIKQPVLFADFNWTALSKLMADNKIQFHEIPKFPAVHRDLSIVVPNHLKYEAVEKAIASIHLHNLTEVRLFDVFESEKLGAGKKSMAINFIFLDKEKTLTDKEIDGWIDSIISTLKKELNAEIRK